MLDFEHILNHASRALDRLISEYRGKPFVESVIRVFADEVQRIEDVLNEFMTERWLADAVGVQLDQVGQIIGEPRGDSANDTEYRNRITARRQANRSRGTVDDIIGVMTQLFTGLGITDKYIPKYQAGFVYLVTTPITTSLGRLAKGFLRDSKAAAVRGILHWQEQSDASSFVFFDGTGIGFDDGTGTVGGKWAAASLAGADQGS